MHDFKSLHGDEYYTKPEHVFGIIDNLNLPKGSVVWCPFDTEKSHFPILLSAAGYKVTNGHIDTGEDFFITPHPPEDCAAIITNPPFSLKKNTLKRAKELGIPFALILPILFVGDGVPLDYGNQMIFWRKRMDFDFPDRTTRRNRMPCIALSNGLFKQDLKIIY